MLRKNEMGKVLLEFGYKLGNTAVRQMLQYLTDKRDIAVRKFIR